MSKLEELVPPPELCEKIPEGEFMNAAFAWHYTDVAGFVCGDGCRQVSSQEWQLVRSNISRIIRAKARGEKIFPAPTLEEVLEDLPKDNAYNDLHVSYTTRSDLCPGWHIYYIGDRHRHKYDKSAVTAAIMLWLQLKG